MTKSAQAIIERGFERLESLLGEERSLYISLAELLDQQREAVRIADVDELTRVSAHERTLVDALRVVDQRRSQLATAIGQELGFGGEVRPALSTLLEHAGPRRGRLVVIADELRRLIKATRAASAVVRLAAESLACHMQGIVQSVEAGFNRSGVYERAGRLANGVRLHTAIDIRS